MVGFEGHGHGIHDHRRHARHLSPSVSEAWFPVRPGVTSARMVGCRRASRTTARP
jgi:hypothetical protein